MAVGSSGFGGVDANAGEFFAGEDGYFIAVLIDPFSDCPDNLTIGPVTNTGFFVRSDVSKTNSARITHPGRHSERMFIAKVA